MDTLPIALCAPELMTALEFNVAIQQPCMTWGPPGVGKSQLHAQLATRLAVDLKDVRAMLMNPVDVNGLPHIIHQGDAAAVIAKLQAASTRADVTMQEIINILKGEGDGTDYMGETIWSRPGILPRVGSGILLFDEISPRLVHVLFCDAIIQK
jgi:MoxR-like ATPase